MTKVHPQQLYFDTDLETNEQEAVPRSPIWRTTLLHQTIEYQEQNIPFSSEQEHLDSSSFTNKKYVYIVTIVWKWF